MNLIRTSALAVMFCLSAMVGPLSSNIAAQIQEPDPPDVSIDQPVSKPLVTSILPNYLNRAEGLSLPDIVRAAVETNGEIKIARLEVGKAKARLTQARLRTNPTLEIEQTSGTLLGSTGNGEISVGVSTPVDVYGLRRGRIGVAEAEITLKEAEVTVLQCDLTHRIAVSYADALSALKELSLTEELLELDMQIVRFVQIRVNEGETAPLELNLLQTEVERLRSRLQLTEGRLQAALTKLKLYAGMPTESPLRLREEIDTASFQQLPSTLETGSDIALRGRPEIRVAELEEQLASAGLRLIRAQGKPDLTGYTRYTQGRATFDDPRGNFAQRDRSLTFGVAIGLPVFNRNQGAKAEAEIAIRQAQERRSFAEAVIKSEVAAALQRIRAANLALSTLETGVLPRARQNIETIRQVYQIGELKVTELINEQRKLVDATRDLTEVLTERYRAQADLVIALGIRLEN